MAHTALHSRRLDVMKVNMSQYIRLKSARVQSASLEDAASVGTGPTMVVLCMSKLCVNILNGAT